ncbi:Peptide methionine sulfoxide reductase MrsB [Trinorchestia longiramus]|nr:Peptide methionine sulfoxide reductase MrsB [Trinorchestia longiramus]
MEGASQLRRPTSGPFAERLPTTSLSSTSPAQISSSRNSYSSNDSSPRNSTSSSSSITSSLIPKSANGCLSSSNLPSEQRRDSTGLAVPSASPAPNKRPSAPQNRISSTLSKFERNDALAKSSTLKPVPRRQSSENISVNNGIAGNKFLNGKTLKSVSSNRFSLGNPPVRGGLGGSVTPSSLIGKSGAMQGRTFSNKAIKNNNKKTGHNSEGPKRVLKQEEKQQLLKKLTPTQYRVTQEKITERPYSNVYYKHWDRGIYSCVVCGEELFQSHTKYDSGSGWPAFYDIISWDRVTLKQDLSHVGANLLLLVCNPSLARTEVSCATCNSHIGHVFDDGPKPTGQRFCVNSASLSFRSTESERIESKDEVEKASKNSPDQDTDSHLSTGDTLAPLVHMASPSNSCSLGARLCFRVPASIDGYDGPASRT